MLISCSYRPDSKIFVILLLCLMLRPDPNILGAGLSTYLAKVKISNLEPGKKYSLKQLSNMSLKVVNTGDSPVNLKVEPTIPQISDCETGYQPLPDLSWIKFESDYFENVQAGSSIETDVYVSIPDSYLYLGKKYQVYLWSHTVADRGGFGIGVGLNSKLFIEILDYSALEPAQTEKTSFKLKPTKLKLQVKSGEKKETKLQITNLTDGKQRYILKFVTEHQTFSKKYELIKDTSSVVFSEKDFELGPKSIKDIDINIFITESNEKNLLALLDIVCLSKKKQESFSYPVHIKIIK